jgi:hypothetical protein
MTNGDGGTWTKNASYTDLTVPLAGRYEPQYQIVTTGTTADGTQTTSISQYGASVHIAFSEEAGLARIGTPSVIETGGTYTAETGSNRLAVFAVGAEGATTSACETSALTFGGVNATLIRQRDTASNTYNGVSVYVIPESSIPSGAQTVSATFVGSPANSFIICLTLENADQSVVYDGSTDNAANSSAAELSWTLATNNSGGLGLCFAAAANDTVQF